MRTRGSRGEGWLRGRPWVVMVLVGVNLVVFAAQHLTGSGYQKLVPREARAVAERLAGGLRAVGQISLAVALERRLRVPGEVDRISEGVAHGLEESRARLAELKVRQARGDAQGGIRGQIREVEAEIRVFRDASLRLKVLPELLGASHESGGVSLEELREGRVWTLLTHMFVHGSAMHLLLNMVVLAAAGVFVVMCLGARHFLALFFVGGLIGAGLQVSFFPNVYLIGASAGVYATTIAALLLLPEDTFYRYRIRLRPHVAAIGVTIVALVMLIWTLATAGRVTAAGQSVAHLAHLGGIMTGWYYVRMLGISPRRSFSPDAIDVSPESGSR